MVVNDVRWIRTCQECGYEQATRPPSKDRELTVSYQNSKCRHCHSEGSLDYGHYEHELDEE